MSGLVSTSWRSGTTIRTEIHGGRGRRRFAEERAAHHLKDGEALEMVEARHPMYVFEAVAKVERVIFRKFPHNGEIIALFPDQYNARNGNIGSYAHHGQHAETAPDFGDTKPAEWHDYNPLHVELIGQGYHDLRIVKRFGKLGRK